MKIRNFPFACAVAALVLSAPLAVAAQDAGPVRPRLEETLASVIGEDGRFSVFADALAKTGVVGEIAGSGPFTIFAPTDEAFARMDPHKRDVLFVPEHEAELKKLLRYHIVPGRIPPEATELVGNVQALVQQIQLETDEGGVTVNGAPVVVRAVKLKNGVLYGLGEVLVPHYENLFLPGEG